MIMARRPRIHFPGATYHVILRGNNKRDIFTCDRERYRFYSLIREGVERFGHQVLAYCLMSNHLHLAIQVEDVPLADIVQNFSFRYTRYFNFRHERIGHLLHGRYKAIIVDTDAYLRELIRYIHLNPVRARLVTDPAEYAWSGHCGYLGLQDVPWLARDEGLEHFGRSEKRAVQEYDSFVKRGISPAEWTKFQEGAKQGVMGDKEFVTTVNQSARRTLSRKKAGLECLLSRVCDVYGAEASALCRPDYRSSHFRAVAALLARRAQGVTIRELADFVGMEASTLSKAASRLEAKMQQSATLKAEVEQLIESLPNEEIF